MVCYPPETLSNRSNPNRRKGQQQQHWFDADDDVLEQKTMESWESSNVSVDEEKKTEREWEGEQRQACTAEVSAGSGATPGWGRGVVVTRQVLIETSSR